jgi:hypothetical protein
VRGRNRPGNTTFGRITGDADYDMRTCDGYTVVSATDYFK